MKIKQLLFLFLLLIPLFSLGQEVEKEEEKSSKPTIFQALSTSSEIPEVVITTNIKKILREKFSLQAIPAKFEYSRGGKVEEWNIDLTARGKSRRRICYMPPLRIEFSKDQLKENGVRRKHNKLKLVSYCKNRSNFEGYVLREYLAYKMFNVLTDYSFHVQLVNIEYRDSLERFKPVKRLGFIIENTDEMAKRLNAKEKNKYECRRDTLNHEAYDCLALFQYMIGNTDWKINVLHNTKLIRDKDSKEYYPVPYDFDYSGLVNAVYAVPNQDLKQDMVTSRVFMGESISTEEMESTRLHFLGKKDQIYNLEEFALMKKGDRKRVKKYLKCFFKTVESKKKFRKDCLRKGQTWN